MTAKEACASGKAVTDTILIGYVPVCVLFDSDASQHYFMLFAFIIHRTIPCITLDLGLNINTGNGIITVLVSGIRARGQYSGEISMFIQIIPRCLLN